jgi:hypothetical protein
VRHSVIRTKDDAIAIKSGLNLAGIRKNLPSKNIVVHNITAEAWSAAGLAVGSEMSGGVSNVTFSECHISHSKYGIRVKSLRGRGGIVEDIRFEMIYLEAMRTDAAAIQLSMDTSRHPGYVPIVDGWRLRDVPVFRNIGFSNFSIDSQSAQAGILIEGSYEFGMILSGRTIRDITFDDMGVYDIPFDCLNAGNVRLDGNKKRCKLGFLYGLGKIFGLISKISFFMEPQEQSI